MWNRVHFSSASGEWETPQDVFDWANAKWGPLTLDVCATEDNTKCLKFYTKIQDGLSLPWDEPWWCNPPYGRGINAWVEMGFLSKYAGGVMLLPARTDTAWFHEYCARSEVYFLRGRLKFGGSKNSAPFPSMIVRFGLPSVSNGQLTIPDGKERGLA